MAKDLVDVHAQSGRTFLDMSFSWEVAHLLHPERINNSLGSEFTHLVGVLFSLAIKNPLLAYFEPWFHCFKRVESFSSQNPWSVVPRWARVGLGQWLPSLIRCCSSHPSSCLCPTRPGPSPWEASDGMCF